MSNKIFLPQLAWHSLKQLDVDLPQSWRVEVCNMAGHDRPCLSSAAIKEAVANPIGMPPLREYARGKKQAVIIFDDMTRVTRTSDMLPALLEELAAAGIPDKSIRFIAACGCHAAMNRADFAKKLGEDIMARFPAYNHSPFHNCEYVGTTSRGTRVSINAEVMSCDLKIGIGSVVPHIMAGYGGGGKLVLPGVAAYESVVELHAPDTTGVGSTVTGMGNIEDNPRRRDIEEATEMAGLDMKIDALVNARGETVAVYAGRPQQAFAAALEEARKHYLTPVSRDNDVVIANTFAKANEAISGLLIAFPAVSQKGGDVVLLANAPEGQMTHYLMGPFGNEIGGLYRLRMTPPPSVDRLIVYTEYPERSSLSYMEESERIVLAHRWHDVLELLKERHGDGTKVAVYPSSDIQYCAG